MARVTGIGGVFWRARDPDAVRTWYVDTLGIDEQPDGTWHQEAGPTVLAAFARDSEYFGREQQVMLNFRVQGLPGLLERLRGRGVEILREEQQDGVGEFAWILDPEGNRIELWQPDEE